MGTHKLGRGAKGSPQRVLNRKLGRDFKFEVSLIDKADADAEGLRADRALEPALRPAVKVIDPTLCTGHPGAPLAAVLPYLRPWREHRKVVGDERR